MLMESNLFQCKAIGSIVILIDCNFSRIKLVLSNYQALEFEPLEITGLEIVYKGRI